MWKPNQYTLVGSQAWPRVISTSFSRRHFLQRVELTSPLSPILPHLPPRRHKLTQTQTQLSLPFYTMKSLDVGRVGDGEMEWVGCGKGAGRKERVHTTGQRDRVAGFE